MARHHSPEFEARPVREATRTRATKNFLTRPDPSRAAVVICEKRTKKNSRLVHKHRILVLFTTPAHVSLSFAAPLSALSFHLPSHEKHAGGSLGVVKGLSSRSLVDASAMLMGCPETAFFGGRCFLVFL